jgi:hypothetical protein
MQHDGGQQLLVYMTVDLLTRSSLAWLLNADPRSKLLSDVQPIAFLLNGRRRLPLFSAHELERLKEQPERKA